MSSSFGGNPARKSGEDVINYYFESDFFGENFTNFLGIFGSIKKFTAKFAIVHGKAIILAICLNVGEVDTSMRDNVVRVIRLCLEDLF